MAAVVFFAVALVQAVSCAPSHFGCGPFPLPGPVGSYPSPLPGPIIGVPVNPGYGYNPYPLPGPGSAFGFEEGCCPGPVVEQNTVVERPVTVPFSFTEPFSSQRCFQKTSVSRDVVPSAFETAPTCQTVKQVTSLPATDITTVEQPLVKTTCTTSEYVIQIPIVETTCTSSPLCKKTVRSQNNILTNVAKRTKCAKQVCSQNRIVQQPFTETVCQNFEGAVTKAGTRTVLNPEVIKSCHQLPPYKCLKPAAPVTFAGVGGYTGGAGIVGGASYLGDAGFSGSTNYVGAAPSFPIVGGCGC